MPENEQDQNHHAKEHEEQQLAPNTIVFYEHEPLGLFISLLLSLLLHVPHSLVSLAAHLLESLADATTPLGPRRQDYDAMLLSLKGISLSNDSCGNSKLPTWQPARQPNAMHTRK
jgi:hypothetical protein